MTQHHSRAILIGFLILSLVASACGGTDAEVRPTPGASLAPEQSFAAEPMAPSQLGALGDTVVIRVTESAPPRPEAPKNPLLEVRANGSFVVWAPDLGQVAGEVGPVTVGELVAEADRNAGRDRGRNGSENGDHCTFFSFEWQPSPTTQHRAEWGCDEAPDDTIRDWLRATTESLAATRGAAVNPLTGEDLIELGEDTVLSIRLDGDPWLEITASGAVSVRDDTAGIVRTGELDRSAAADRLGVVHRVLSAFAETNGADDCAGRLSAAWVQPNWRHGELTRDVCTDGPLLTALDDIRTDLVVELGGSTEDPGDTTDDPAQTEEERRVVLSLATAGDDDPRNPLLEVRTSGAVSIWDERSSTRHTGTVLPTVVDGFLDDIRSAAERHVEVGVAASTTACPAYTITWSDDDARIVEASVDCAGIDRSPDLYDATIVAYFHLLDAVTGTGSGLAAADLDTLTAYVEQADSGYLRGWTIADRIAQLEGNCVTTARLSAVADAVEPADTADFLVQHLFVCSGRVWELSLDDDAFTEDLDGLRAFAAATDGARAADDDRLESLVDDLRRTCASGDLRSVITGTDVDPVRASARHAFVCPTVVTSVGSFG